jgi:O-antigen ligase
MPHGRFGGVPVRADAASVRIGLARLAFDVSWIVFFFFASLAGYFIEVERIERYFWALADLGVLMAVLLRPRELLELVRANAVFMTWPLLAGMSALWSYAPAVSLYHGAQLAFTIMAGLVLVLYRDLDRILRILFFAFLISAIFSLVFTLAVPEKGLFGPEGAWAGVFPHKNVLGETMALLIITGLVLLLDGWRPLLTVAGVTLAVVLLGLSQSASSMTALVLTLAVLPPAFCFRKGAALFMMSCGLSMVGLAAGLLAFEVTNVDLIETVLSALGKDETLTGRTVIWDIGMAAYESHSWLGFGFKGYWEGAGTTAPYLRFVLGQDLWTFHNNFLEVAVAFGVIGPVIFAVVFCVAFFRAFTAIGGNPRFTNLWPLLFLVMTLVLCFVEVPLFFNHSMNQVLFIVAAARVAFVEEAADDVA